MMKRILSAILAVCVIASMGIGAFAANTLTGFRSGYALQNGYNRQYNLTGTPNAITNNTVDLGEFYASDNKVVNIGLYNEMFVDKNGWAGGENPTPALRKLTAAEIRSAKLQVKLRYMTGSKVIDKISLDTKNGTVKVQFVDEWASTKSQDFELFLYLTINGQSYTSQGLTIIGTLANNEVDLYSGYDSAYTGDGSILVANDNIRNVEIDTGNDVTIIANLSRGKKYYGKSNTDYTAADEYIMDKYTSIQEAITINQVDLDRSGNTVKLGSTWYGYYVYDEDLAYLGRSNQKLAFRTKYYLATRQLNVGGSGNGSGSGSSGNGGSTTTPPPVEVGGELTKAQATSLFQTALKSKPSSQKTLTIKTENKATVSLATLQEIQRLANNAKVTPTLLIDNKSGNAVQTRLYITPSKATKGINTTVSINTTAIKATENRFKGWFRNELMVVGCGQKGSYGMQVRMTVKAPSTLKTNNLYFYAYDSAANTYQRITSANYTVDSSGYVYFYTQTGGDIVISNGALSK